MGSAWSVLPDPLPATEEEALAAGYTPEQIAQYKDKENAAIAPEAAAAPPASIHDANNDDAEDAATTPSATAPSATAPHTTTPPATAPSAPPITTTPASAALLEPGQPLMERARALLALSPEEREAHEASIHEALLTREKMRRAKRKAEAKKSNDYEKSLSGTAADTKKEKDFANLLAGEEPSGPRCEIEIKFEDVLRPIGVRDCGGGGGGGGGKNDQEEEEGSATESAATALYEQLRRLGRWFRIADAAGGVTFFVHSLTNEESFRRPEDYVDGGGGSGSDGGAGDGAGREDPCAGLASCDMEDLLGVIDAVIEGRACEELIPGGDSETGGGGGGGGGGSGGASSGEGSRSAARTPLFVDNSEDAKVLTYFKYKGTVVDLEPLGWSRKRQSDEKISASKVMEQGRRLLVNGMKHGKICCLSLGEMASENALKDICKPTSIDVKTFERGGRRLAATRPTFDGLVYESEKSEYSRASCRSRYHYSSPASDITSLLMCRKTKTSVEEVREGQR
jgi:hypothetical protein